MTYLLSVLNELHYTALGCSLVASVCVVVLALIALANDGVGHYNNAAAEATTRAMALRWLKRAAVVAALGSAAHILAPTREELRAAALHQCVKGSCK